MAPPSEAVLSALREVREAESAIADRLRAHLATTDDGEPRRILERYLSDAQSHVSRIDTRLGTLQPHGWMRAALSGPWHLTRQAVRLPLAAAKAVPATVWRGHGRTPEQQTLKRAKEEYMLTAYAVAAGRAAARVAQEAGDNASSDLLRSIRRDNEELLEVLGRNLVQHAEAMMTAAPAPESTDVAEDAAQIMRTEVADLRESAKRWGHQLQETAQRGRPGLERTLDTVKGAATAEAELPIPHYGQLNASQVINHLAHLSQTDLATVHGYERAHADRITILNKITSLLEPEPWPGYDTMSAVEIRTRLRQTDSDSAQQVLAYERRHRTRSTVTAAARHACA